MTFIRPATRVDRFIALLSVHAEDFPSSKSAASITDKQARNVPLVSLITPFVNRHRHFEDTFRSVIHQSWQDFEWIIVDDCSTAIESRALFDALPARSDKIRTLPQRSKVGAGAGRNMGVREARGRYLFFMDGDGLLDPTYLEKCALFLETHPEVSFVNSYGVCFDGQEYWCEHGFNNKTVAQFYTQNWVTAMLMYRKADFEATGDFEEGLICYEDWERWLRALAAGQRGWTIPEFLHCQRRAESELQSGSLQNEAERRRAEEFIRERYAGLATDERAASATPVRPTSYAVGELRRRLVEGASTERAGADERGGRRLLCLFPHLEMGGADKFNLDLLARLKERGYRITVGTTLPAQQRWHEQFYRVTSDIHHLTHYLHDNHWIGWARRMIESRSIDTVLVSNSYLGYYLVPLLRAEYTHVAFLDYVHIYDPGWRVDGYPRLSRQFSPHLDVQIVSCEHLAAYYESLNPGGGHKTRVCYINVDTDYWQPDPAKRQQIRAALNIPDNVPLLLFPARLEEQKRPHFVVEIARQLKAQSVPFVVGILGSGSLLDATQQQIRDLELEDVFRVLPPVTPDEMVGFYSASDLLLLPTEYEGISMAIYEAMAMGLPVVASAVGGQRELVVEGTGFLLEKGAGDAAEAAEYVGLMRPLLENAALRAKTGRAARQRVERFFTQEAMCARMEMLINEAIEARRNGPAEKTDVLLAEELLSVALECSQLDQGWIYLSEQNKQLRREHHQLTTENEVLRNRKLGMESSRFWKIRNQWFKIKYKIGLTQERV